MTGQLHVSVCHNPGHGLWCVGIGRTTADGDFEPGTLATSSYETHKHPAALGRAVRSAWWEHLMLVHRARGARR